MSLFHVSFSMRLIHKCAGADIILNDTLFQTKLSNNMCFCLFCFLRKDGYLDVILVITKCLPLGKVAAQGRGGVHLKMFITGCLLPAPPIRSHLPFSSLAIPGCITPIHIPGCGVTCSGIFVLTHTVGRVPMSDIDAPSDPLGSLYYFCVPVPGFLPSFHFPLECFCFLQPTPVTLLQGRYPGPPGRGPM